MVDCAPEIVNFLSTDPTGLAISLFSKRLIYFPVLSEINELNETKAKKASRLYTEMLKIVEQRPEKYSHFVDTLEDQKQCEDKLILKLGRKYTSHGKSLLHSYRYHYCGAYLSSRGRCQTWRSYCPRKRKQWCYCSK